MFKIGWKEALGFLILLWVISPATELIIGYGLAQIVGVDIIDMATIMASMLS